jgi:Tol biopolymer transport system component
MRRGWRRWGIVLGAVLAAAAATQPAHGAFPVAKNGTLVYESTDGPNDLHVVSSEAPGSTNITNTPAPVSESDGRFSPTGRAILFSRSTGGPFDLWTTAPDGSAQVNITNSPTLNEFDGAFFPDGRSIIFSRCDAAFVQCELFRAAADGTDPVQLTSTPGLPEFNPSVSPDGRQIAFRQNIGDDREIFIMNVDGTGLRNLTNTPEATTFEESRPKFSADGKWIYFDRFDAANQGDIFRMKTDGSELTNLTNTPSFLDVEVAPSPDGKRLAFSSCPVSCDILVGDELGAGLTNLTPTPGPLDERNPDWEPIPRCGKSRATIVGDDGPDKIKGTKRKDVIVAFGGKDTVRGRGGNDRICLGKGKDKAIGGGGEDKCVGGKGNDSGTKCEKGKL